MIMLEAHVKEVAEGRQYLKGEEELVLNLAQVTHGEVVVDSHCRICCNRHR